MAEIKIEKKKPVWPWIILVLLALGLIWYFYMRNTDNRVIDNHIVGQQVDTTANENMDTYSSLDLYSSFIADTAKMGVDHEYSMDALNRLIDAVEEKSYIHNVDLTTDLDEARSKAAEITKDPNSLNHADLLKSSGKIIARALTSLQTSNNPNLTDEMAKVNASVDEIDTTVNTLDQKDKVRNFFNSAESLLLKMQ